MIATRRALSFEAIRVAWGKFVEDALGPDIGVIWVEQNAPREKRPLVALSLYRPLRRRGRDYVQDRRAPKRVRVQLTGPVVDGQESIAIVNGWDYRSRATGASTLTTLRDDLVSQIDARRALGYAATPVGADAFDLQGVADGDLAQVQAYPAGACDAYVLEQVTVREVVGEREGTVRFDVYSRQGALDDAADEILETLRTAIHDPNLRGALRKAGVAPRGAPGDPFDLSDKSGGAREMRVLSDQRFAMRSRLLVESDPPTIDTVVIAGSLSGSSSGSVALTPDVSDLYGFGLYGDLIYTSS